MYAYDVDGDVDVVTSLMSHGYGVALVRADDANTNGRIGRRERLGGVLNFYSRAA